jgi:hypothetical protein
MWAGVLGPYPVTVNWLLPKIERTTVIEDFLRTSLARMTAPGFRFRLENEPPAAREQARRQVEVKSKTRVHGTFTHIKRFTKRTETRVQSWAGAGAD